MCRDTALRYRRSVARFAAEVFSLGLLSPRLRDPDARVPVIEHRVIRPDEDVAEYPQRPRRRRHVQTCGVELKGVRSGVERRRGRGLKGRGGWREKTAKVLKDRRSPRERGRMGNSVTRLLPMNPLTHCSALGFGFGFGGSGGACVGGLGRLWWWWWRPLPSSSIASASSSSARSRSVSSSSSPPPPEVTRKTYCRGVSVHAFPPKTNETSGMASTASQSTPFDDESGARVSVSETSSRSNDVRRVERKARAKRKRTTHERGSNGESSHRFAALRRDVIAQGFELVQY